MEYYEETLRQLSDKYGWNLTDSLTETGRKLVKDTIEAHAEVKNFSSNLPVTSSNAFERLPLHWKLIYYYIGGILTGLLLHYCW